MSDHIFTKEEFKARVSDCRVCHVKKCALLLTGQPRYGLGPLGADLMVIGQNPPFANDRRLHGAWMLHYPQTEKYQRGSHELLVERLMAYLGLNVSQQVYATQAVKCATYNNAEPGKDTKNLCPTWHLEYEIQMVQPKVILSFGQVARAAAFHCVMHARYQLPAREEFWYYNKYKVTTFKHLVMAPHPSVVGRFLDEGWWMGTIKDAVNHVRSL